jgi:hypothetical protein
MDSMNRRVTSYTVNDYDNPPRYEIALDSGDPRADMTAAQEFADKLAQVKHKKTLVSVGEHGCSNTVTVYPNPAEDNVYGLVGMAIKSGAAFDKIVRDRADAAAAHQKQRLTMR